MTGPRESVERVTAVLQTLRPYLGWICCAAGAVLCALGWYGVSGERYTARQIPYLASATAPGVALITGGLVLLAARTRAAEQGPGQQRLRSQVAALHALLTEPELEPEPEPAPEPEPEAEAGPGGRDDGSLLAVPGGSTYHRSGCTLLEGREPERITPATAAGRGLRPCPLCDPPAV